MIDEYKEVLEDIRTSTSLLDLRGISSRIDKLELKGASHKEVVNMRNDLVERRKLILRNGGVE